MDADTLRWINTLLNVAMFAALIWAVRAGLGWGGLIFAAGRCP